MRTRAKSGADGAEPCEVEIQKFLSEKQTIKVHHPPAEQQRVESRIVLPEFWRKTHLRAFGKDAVHDVRARIQQPCIGHSCHYRAPNRQNVIPEKESADEQIPIFFHLPTQPFSITKEGGGTLQFAERFWTGIEFETLRAGNEGGRRHGHSIMGITLGTDRNGRYGKKHG